MKFASILIITICLSLMGCRGGSSDDTPPKQYAPTQVFQFKSTPTNFVLIGNTYSYSPIPKDTFFNEDFYILSAVIDGVDLSMQFSGNKEITWTPLSSDIGKEIEFSVNVTSGDFINLKHTWRVQVVNPEEIKTGEINGDDFVFEKLTELKGYQLTIPSTNELQEVATKLSFTNVNLTSGQFEGKQSPAFVLELSGGNLATKDGAGVALKINLTEAGLSPAADDEVYYLVSQWQQSDGQSSDDDSGFNIIQMNEDNNTLNGFLQAINNPYSNTRSEEPSCRERV